MTNELITGLAAIIGTLLGAGGFVSAAFRWLAKRDDRRETERAQERANYLEGMRLQREAFREQLGAIVDRFVEDRDKDRQMQRESNNMILALVARVNGIEQ